jgi:hypothetical protein
MEQGQLSIKEKSGHPVVPSQVEHFESPHNRCFSEKIGLARGPNRKVHLSINPDDPDKKELAANQPIENTLNPTITSRKRVLRRKENLLVFWIKE